MTGRQRFTARGICTTPPPTSRWTGSARSPRRPRWSARPGRAPTPRPTAGWTPSPTGAGLRACRPPRSPGAPGARSAARPRSLAEPGAGMITPDEGAYAFETLLRHDRAYSGYADHRAPWLTALCAARPFAEAFLARERDAVRQTALTERSARCLRRNGPADFGIWSASRSVSSCDAPSIPTARSPNTASTRWATSNCAPASRPRPEFASPPRPSPRTITSAVLPSICRNRCRPLNSS